MASGLRRQAMVGLPWLSTPVVTVISSPMRWPMMVATRSSTCFLVL
jgi:hypothetical protein